MVFVHGLGGDAFETWRFGVDESTSWPHWLGEEFPEVGVWSVGYAASPTKLTRFKGWFSKGSRDAGHGMSLPARAGQMLDFMVQRGLGERPLFFICHSLGGLVAKQILRASYDDTSGRLNQVFRNTRAVLFLATPHTGADLASLVSAFRGLFGATVTTQELRAHDAHLFDLLDWYRDHTLAANIQTATYFEQHPVRGFMIVKPAFAHPGVGAHPVALDEDHISIAKPRERNAQVCGKAREMLHEFVLAPRPAPAARIAESPGVVALGELKSASKPHELPPKAEAFFGRGEELRLLITRLRARLNTAVSGPAGMGKTGLAAEALMKVVGETSETLSASPFPDGVVFLDLYTLHAAAEDFWSSLANKLAGPGFMDRSPARERAVNACLARRILVVIEGGEEADGQDGRASIHDLLSVLSPENRWLLLTRLKTQAAVNKTVFVEEALHAEDAAKLFDELTKGRVSAAVRAEALELLAGHPLALTWACSPLAEGADAPELLVNDWRTEQLPSLSDPEQAKHTLQWLFERSVRGLDATTKQALEAAALLGLAPFPHEAIDAALRDSVGAGAHAGRTALKSLAQRNLLRTAAQAQWQFTHVLGYRFARRDAGSDAAIRMRLAQWLWEELRKTLGIGTAAGGSLSIAHALEHLDALLRADDNQSLWEPIVNAALYDFVYRLIDLGRLGQVKAVLRSVAGWLDQLPSDMAQESSWLRERASLASSQGDVLSAQGDLAGALAAFRESLQLARRLAESDPSNTDWQRDLSVSQNKVGDVMGSQGDLSGALAAYQDGLQLSERLAESDPSNTLWQRDLFVSHNKVGDVLLDQGDLAGALAAYQDSLQLIGRLAEADPSNTVWQRDLSVSQERVGEVLRGQGNPAGALAAYQDSLQLIRRLADADPSNAGWQRDYSFSLTRMAQLYEQQGDRTKALRFAKESLMIDERLASLDRTNATWQEDVAISRALVARLRG